MAERRHDSQIRVGVRLRLTVVALACSLVALVCGTFLFVRQSQLVREATRQEAFLNGWLVELQGVLISITDAETGQRGYLLTGKDRYLVPYHDASGQLPETLKRLEAIGLSEPSMMPRIRNIQERTRRKLSELEETILLFDRGQTAAALAMVQTDVGQTYMEGLRADIAAVSAVIRENRKAMSQRVVAGSVDTQRLAVVTVGTLLVAVALAAAQIGMLISAQRRYQLALATSEQQHRAIVEEQTELIALVAADGSLTYINPAYAQFFHINDMSLAGRSLYDGLGHAAHIVMASRIAEVLEAGQPASLECRTFGSGGQPRWVAWRMRLHPTVDGALLVHVVGRDITKSKSVEEALRASEAFLTRTGRVGGVGGWEVDLESGQIHWSEQVRRIHGVSDDYVPQLDSAFSFFPEEAAQLVRNAVAAAQTSGRHWDLEVPFVDASGRHLYVRTVGDMERDANGKPIRLIGAFQDITERVAARKELAHQAATVNAIIEAIPAMVSVWDTQMRYQLVNSAFERWRARPRADFIGKTIPEVLGNKEHQRTLPWLKRAMAGETVTYEQDFPEARDARHVSFNCMPLRLPDGTVGGLISFAQDITQHREENIRLVLMSERDPLTGLMNRAGFESYLTRKCDQGNGASLAILYIDLDHFKQVNDTQGHARGDEVLRQFGARVQGCVRPTDAVARLGGDEFAIVMAHVTDAGIAATVADKIAGIAAEPFLVDGRALRIGASIGVALDADAAGGWRQLVARADTMAYRAKKGGRGKYVLALKDENDITMSVRRPNLG
jgi:diguanylate cyclase (GGDEF)-like protein/PAS domain S-box-containing protein